MKEQIKKIKKTKPGGETYMAKMTVLKELVQHHVEEEEDEYFPECKRKFGKERLVAIGEEMELAMEKLEKKPRLTLARTSNKHESHDQRVSA